MRSPVGVSVARAKEIMESDVSFSESELVAAANTIISQAQAILCNESRIEELEERVAESERQRKLAIDMVAVALKVEVRQ